MVGDEDGLHHHGGCGVGGGESARVVGECVDGEVNCDWHGGGHHGGAVDDDVGDDGEAGSDGVEL